MLKQYFEKYFRCTKGCYPFFKDCPFFYRDYFLRKIYLNKLGKEPDFKNPVSFNEKIRWLIYNEKRDLKTKLSDKILVKKWVTEKLGGGYCAELYGIWNKFSEIKFNNLPDKFALKANHGWKMNLFIMDKENFIKHRLDFAENIVKKWMKINYFDFSLEPQYKNIKKKLYAEKLRDMKDGSFSCDYQIHCFNGEPVFIEIMPPAKSMPYKGIRSIQFYDINWNLQPFTYFWELNEIPIEKPVFIDEMIMCAKKLSKDFAYVRVDFALDGDKVNFAEMTFSPSSAMILFNKPEFDNILGNMIKLPIR